MSFIAGYISKSGKLETAWVQQRLADFQILAGDEPDSFENGVLDIPSGHLLWKFRKNSLMPPTITTDGDNKLLTLGFHLANGQRVSGRDLIRKCREKGAQTIEQIEGEFVTILSEGYNGTLHIVNDRFASRPMFLLEKHRGVYFSSNLIFLQYFTQKKQDYDITGCLQLFSYGLTIGERTTFSNIKRIEPANHMFLTPQTTGRKKYWAFAHEPDENLNPDRFSEKVFGAFRRATQSRVRLFGNGIVALSGGLDSRLLTGAMPIDSGFNAFTFIDSTQATYTPEVNAASAVARILGIKHTIKSLDHNHISKVAQQVVRLTGGLVPLHHPAKVMKYISEMKRHNHFFLLGGAPGNNLSGSFIPSLKYLDPKNLKSCMHNYCIKMNLGGANELKTYLSTVFRNEIIDSFLTESINEMNNSVDSAGGPTAAHKISAWQMCTGFPAYSANSPIHNHPDVMEAFAHLDYTYCNLMSQLPSTWLYKRNFYEYMIYTCLPEFRHIIYANTGKKLKANFLPINISTLPNNNSFYWEHLRSKLAKSFAAKQGLSWIKQSLRMLCTSKQANNNPPFMYQAMKEDNFLLSFIIDTIHSNPGLSLLFNPNKCLKLINGIKAGHKQTLSFHHDAELLGSLASICYTAANFDSI